MPPALAPTWAITAAAGQAPSVIRLRNLQATARIGLDAWSRPCRPQPILISACVSLARPSTSSSSADRVNADTVHYGLLSKAILSTLDEVDHRAANGGDGEHLSLRDLLDEIWMDLVGQRIDGSDGPAMAHTPFLDQKAMRCLSVSIRLPKASPVGGCVGLTGTSLFEGGEAQTYGVALELAHMQVPTLIGINENERKAKQVVIADVTLDCFEDGDIYPHLENAVYDKMANSEFGTLEALATDLADAIRSAGAKTSRAPAAPPHKWQIKIKLEKPIAVPLAEGAGIEFISGPAEDA